MENQKQQNDALIGGSELNAGLGGCSIRRKENAMERWTNNEEEELQRLMKRKADLMEKNMAPLFSLVNSLEEHEDLAKQLAARADAFRDALEPFDSGYRVASVSE